MIISASYRTDIPAFYGAWFQNRLEAGYALVESPYGGRPIRLSLRPEAVEAFIFWTRNIAPFAPALEKVSRLGLPFAVTHTLTGYPRELEPSVIDAGRATAAMRDLAARHGPRVLVWRYDPILITSLTPADWHLENFRALAGGLKGATDEVTVSFAHIYKKSARNLAAAAKLGGFAWSDPPASTKRQLIGDLAKIAQAQGMRLTVCSQPELRPEGVAAASCIDPLRLGDIAGHPIRHRLKGNRPDCACAESRDLGAYDSCPQGCVYCYAVGGRAKARARALAHDPSAESLTPGLVLPASAHPDLFAAGS
jgi:hypothetical protein